MADAVTTTPKIIDLADQLVADIATRKLKPGDRYLTTADASKMLGVGNGLANRALQLLERRQVITRQQRRGAFVSAPKTAASSPPLRRVHFLVHQNYLTAEGIGNDLVLLGMQEELPGVHVQISFLPTMRSKEFVEELIDDSLTAKARDGFVLVRVPYEVQQLVSDRGVSGVVYGALYPGVERLTRLDRDMTAVGEIAANYLLDRGHHCIGYISRQQTLPGDHDTMDAIRRCLGAKGVAVQNLVERFLPSDAAVCQAEMRRLLERQQRPTGFICRSRIMADAATAVFEEAGLKLHHDVHLVVCDYYLLPAQQPRYVFPRPLLSAEEQGKHLARLLAAQSRGESVPDELIPVQLDATAAGGGR